MKTAADAMGTKVSVDHLGRPTKILYPDGRTISYVYDDVGNISKIVDSVSGTISYQYDILDRLTKVTYPDGNVISYAYDVVGNRRKMTYPNGVVIYYDYNPNNWLTEVIAGTKKIRFEYDKVGNLIKKHLPNGIVISYSYNATGRLTNLTVTDAKGSILFSFSYSVDAVGNCLGIERNSGGLENRTTYEYDPLYRLIEIKQSDGSKAKYQYDAVGNRLSAKVSSLSNLNIISRYFLKTVRNLGISWEKTRYNYDFENRLLNASDREFRYDDKGNLVEKKVGNKTTRYSYNYDNKLVKIQYLDGTSNHYTYDPLGRRVSKRYRDGRTVHYVYDDHNLIQETDDKGRLIASYVYDLGIDHPISMTRGGKTYYYLYDHLGSVIALTDEVGKIVAKYEYDAWGKITKEDGDIANPFRFTGREWDEESGFYYYRARYYDPVLGRFISRDPLPTNLQAQNRYVYVNNNPPTYADPFGLTPWAWGPTNWLWQVLQHPSQLLNATYAKQWYAAHSAANWASGGGGRIFAPIEDMVGGYISSFTGNPGSFAQSVWSTGFDVGSFFISAPAAAIKTITSLPFHIAEAWSTGNVTSLLWDSLSSIGSAAGMGAKTIMSHTGFCSNAFWNEIVALQNFGKGISQLDLARSFADTLTMGLSQANVGGVLLDKAAECLTDLEEITGAYWDDKLGQIVLVGKKNGKIEELFLPRMDKDHLAVAMRAVFSGDNLGVSIDPPPSYLESGEFPPDGTKMLVRYLGNTKNTLFGAIMFEADRLLKTLSMGKDNITHDEVTSQLHGFKNELDLSLIMGTEKPKNWHRMWFVIEDMKLDMVVKESADRNSLKFGKATLKVKAEYISKEKNPGVDPVADRFAKHFTLHFDEFAKEFPILERLRELAKISAIVKYLKNSGKLVDLSFLNDYELVEVPTLKDTQGITASKSKSWQSGNITHTQTYSLYGGVDFDFKYQAVKDDGEAVALMKVAQESKPCETALGWDFKFKEEPQRALVFPIAKTNGNYTTVHADFSFVPIEGLSLELVRCYDSFNSKPSIFGYGWTLKVPFEIVKINTRKPNSPVLLMDRMSGKSNKYIFVEDKQGYFQVNVEKEEGERTIFTYNPQNFIKRNPGGAFTYKSDDGLTYNFDPRGRLTSKVDKNNRRLDYVYEDDRLIKISDSLGNNIQLSYDDRNRVNQVIAPSQTTIDYVYDRDGDLITVSDNKGNVKSYAYDVTHRLIKTKDARGRVVLRNSYDPLGRVIKKKHDVVVDEVGNAINRTYDDDYKLITEKDKAGNAISYEYDQDKNLSRSVISDIKGRKTILEHEKQERIEKIINPTGHSVKFSYDSKGNVISITDPNSHVTHLEYDSNNNPVLLKDAMGNAWKSEYDHLSRLRSLIDPMGSKVEFTHNKLDLIDSIITAEGTTQYQYDERGRLTKSTDANGMYTEYSYDSKGKLIMTRDAAGGLAKYQYDLQGRLSSLTMPNGSSLRYNAKGADALQE